LAIQEMTLKQAEMNRWIELSNKGIINAISGLSQMIGRHVETTALRAKHIPIKHATDILGGPEACAVGVYLAVSGSANGHALLVYEPKTAFALIDMLMEIPPGSTNTLGEMEQSALGEMGNIMGSFFLNTLADITGLKLCVSPPSVIMDMAGSILDAVLADMMRDSDVAVIMEATFSTQDRQVNGTFLVLPSPDLQRALLGNGTR